jgi:hypothetical protein
MDGTTARGDHADNFTGVVRPFLKWETQSAKPEKPSDGNRAMMRSAV